MADIIGCTPQHISAIERGIKTPKLETFVAIANALHVQPNLLLQDVIEHWQEGWEADLVRVLAAVPPRTQQRMRLEIIAAQQALEESNDLTFGNYQKL